jgi:hypothetical protein
MDKEPEISRRRNVTAIRGKLTRMPPGTKSRARLPGRLGEDDPPTTTRRWPVVALVLAALVVGLLVGRFLL